VVLVSDGSLIGRYVSTEQAPAQVVLAFYRDLAAGDGAAAAAAVQAPPGLSELTPADAAFQHRLAGPSLPQLVGHVQRHGATALVTVAYPQVEHAPRLVLELRRVRRNALRGPRWQIIGGLPVIVVRAPAFEQRALVDGRPVALSQGVARVVVFPGEVSTALPAAGVAAAVSQTSQVLYDATETVTPAVKQDVESDLLTVLSPRLLASPAVHDAFGGESYTVILDMLGVASDGRALSFAGQVFGATPATASAVFTFVGGASIPSPGEITIGRLVSARSTSRSRLPVLNQSQSRGR
jgi:hypothetical protein